MWSGTHSLSVSAHIRQQGACPWPVSAPHHDALVHVAVVVLHADADDAGVFQLLVVNGRRHCRGNGSHGDGALVDFGVVVAGRRGGQGVG